jgi:hypothetical protein
MSKPVNLIAVVPESRLQSMISRGFRSTDQANGFTVTMFRQFPDDNEAMREGRKLKCIWMVESVR